jgi:hypothetical protein
LFLVSGKRFYVVSAIAVSCTLLFSLSAQSALAHQRALFTIGGKDYLLVVGSQNEPIFVDDKSGVELFAYTPDPKDPMNSQSNGTKPVEGLEKTLKVELSAGPKKKEMQLEPAFRDPGHYEAPFYPTVQTTYNYRLFGTINNTPVNLTFTCNPAGGGEAQSVNNSTAKISEGVERKGLAGGFSCPQSRSDVAFPEPYMSNTEIQSKLAAMGTTAGSSNHTQQQQGNSNITR